MINLNPDYHQDTLKINKPPVIDSITPIREIIIEKTVSATIDTTSVCSRNSISDVTFYDSANIVRQIIQGHPTGSLCFY